MNDPYGDVEEALAAGLSAHPPLGLLPPEPLPARAAPRGEDANRPSPLRPASFMETMALNTPPAEAPGNREDGPEPAQKPAQETSPATRPQEAAPAEQATRAVSAAPARLAAPAGEPTRAPGNVTGPVQEAPAPAEVTARTPDVPVSPAEQDLPGSPTPAPASPERPLESAPAAVARPPGQTAGSDGTAPDATPDGEEPALIFPEVLPPDVRERQQQERRELEQLLKSGNNDIPVRLPRRPRPQVAPIAAPVVEEDVKPAPPSLRRSPRTSWRA
ncbi:hypothetical protein [Deinococcus aquaticus]|uniref:hypothetical protein n=1 Tax=Deinococcus aquaticus TaxID=328692 RepID=UPI003616DB37